MRARRDRELTSVPEWPRALGLAAVEREIAGLRSFSALLFSFFPLRRATVRPMKALLLLAATLALLAPARPAVTWFSFYDFWLDHYINTTLT